MEQFRRLILTIAAGALCMTMMIGCQTKFTVDNWDMIKVGTYEKIDVEDVLGEPQQKPFGDLWWYHKDSKEAKIYFTDKGVVKAKKWFDAKGGKAVTVPEGWIEK